MSKKRNQIYIQSFRDSNGTFLRLKGKVFTVAEILYINLFFLTLLKCGASSWCSSNWQSEKRTPLYSRNDFDKQNWEKHLSNKFYLMVTRVWVVSEYILCKFLCVCACIFSSKVWKWVIARLQSTLVSTILRVRIHHKSELD